MRLAGSFTQHNPSVLHSSMVEVCLSLSSGRLGRSPSRIFDLTFIALLSPHNNSPRNICPKSTRRTDGGVERMYLGSNEPIREYIGLFGEFAFPKNFRRSPSATFSTSRNPIKPQFPGGHELSKPNVGEASVLPRVDKDVFLDQLHENCTNRCVAE